jgi:hypothetical protein
MMDARYIIVIVGTCILFFDFYHVSNSSALQLSPHAMNVAGMESIRTLEGCYNNSSSSSNSQKSDNVTAVLECVFASQVNVAFVQIGANDGSSFDPLYPLIRATESWRQWYGVLVEPVDALFNVLRESTYAHHADSFDFVQAAVYDRGDCENSTIDFFVHRRAAAANMANDPRAYRRGISGLSIERPGLAQQFERRQVECLSLLELYQRHVSKLGRRHSRRIDLLVTDVEGHDWPLIGQLVRWPHEALPRCILFEWRNEYGDAPRQFLHDMQYYTIDVGNDAIACRVNE